MEYRTFTLSGFSLRMASPNLKRGMLGAGSSTFGTSMGGSGLDLVNATCVADAVAFVANMAAQGCKVQLSADGVRAIFRAHEAAHVLNDHCFIGLCIFAGDAFNVGCRNAAFCFGCSGIPFLRLGVNEFKFGVICIGGRSSVELQRCFDALFVVAHDFVALGIENNERSRVVFILQNGFAGRLVDEAWRAGVGKGEFLVKQVFVDDDFDHRKGERGIGAGPRLNPLGRFGGRFSANGVNYDELAAVFHHLLEALEIALFGDSGIVAPGDNVIALLDLVARVKEALSVNRHFSGASSSAAQ